MQHYSSSSTVLHTCCIYKHHYHDYNDWYWNVIKNLCNTSLHNYVGVTLLSHLSLVCVHNNIIVYGNGKVAKQVDHLGMLVT